MHYQGPDDRAFEDHVAIQTSNFSFEGMDERLGWTDEGDNSDTPDDADDDSFDVDKVPIPPQQEGIIKLICLLLASDDTRLELLTLAAAFGLSTLLGGKSFSVMALESGVSKAAFSKRVLRHQRRFSLPVTLSQKSARARAVYSEIQREVWKRPERQAANDVKLARDFLEPPRNGRKAV